MIEFLFVIGFLAFIIFISIFLLISLFDYLAEQSEDPETFWKEIEKNQMKSNWKDPDDWNDSL